MLTLEAQQTLYQIISGGGSPAGGAGGGGLVAADVATNSSDSAGPGAVQGSLRLVRDSGVISQGGHRESFSLKRSESFSSSWLGGECCNVENGGRCAVGDPVCPSGPCTGTGSPHSESIARAPHGIGLRPRVHIGMANSSESAVAGTMPPSPRLRMHMQMSTTSSLVSNPELDLGGSDPASSSVGGRPRIKSFSKQLRALPDEHAGEYQYSLLFPVPDEPPSLRNSAFSPLSEQYSSSIPDGPPSPRNSALSPLSEQYSSSIPDGPPSRRNSADSRREADSGLTNEASGFAPILPTDTD